jgi:hypothetical protein
MREEKAIARYQDNLQREMDETVFIQLVIHNISYIAKKKLSYYYPTIIINISNNSAQVRASY